MKKKINMKFSLIRIFLFASFSILANASFGQQNDVDTTAIEKEKPVLTNPILVDEVMAIVGNKIILLSDYYSQKVMWRQQRNIHPRSPLSDAEKLDIFEQLMTQKLLAIGAIADSLEVNEVGIVGSVETRINQATASLGSTHELEKMFNAPLYQIREMLTRQMFEEGLANAMKGVIGKDIAITPLDVSKMAKKMSKDSVMIVPRQMSYAHIVKLPPTDYESRLKVKADLLELRRRIVNGSSFSALARMYSDDGSASNGGELDPSALGGEFDSNFENAIKTLKVGGISGIIESEFGYHIIQLMDINNGYYTVRHILMRVEMDADQLNAALVQLDSISNEIRNETITFEDAAKKYSDDKKTTEVGGIVLNRKSVAMLGVKGQTSKFYTDELDYDANAVMGLKVGEVSSAFVTFDQVSRDKVCKIVKLIGDYPEHRANVVDDYSYYENIVMEQKGAEVFDVWINKRLKDTYIRVEAPYNNSIFRYNWLKK